MSSKVIKAKALPLEDKIKILKDVDSNSNITRVLIAKKLNIIVTVLNGIVAKRDLILNSSDTYRKIRKAKKGKYEVMEENMFIWCKQARSANILINGSILREKF